MAFFGESRVLQLRLSAATHRMGAAGGAAISSSKAFKVAWLAEQMPSALAMITVVLGRAAVI